MQVSLLGIDYSVRAHEMHHRKPNTNYGQYVMFWDRLMGTYRPYENVGGSTTWSGDGKSALGKSTGVTGSAAAGMAEGMAEGTESSTGKLS